MRQTERGGTERTGQLGAFLLALALLLVLAVFAHRVVLGLAAVGMYLLVLRAEAFLNHLWGVRA